MVSNVDRLQSDSLPLLFLWIAYKGAFKNAIFTRFVELASTTSFLITFTILDILIYGAIFTGLMYVVKGEYV